MNTAVKLPEPPKVGMVSLGCPKNLVDSERILTKLRADGYRMSGDYAGADVVLVNTCGFLDSAKEESLAAIGEALAENGRVIVTGCMGEEAEVILTLDVPDLRAEAERLREAGVDVGTVVEIPGAIRLLDVFDPDGNRLQLSEDL